MTINPSAIGWIEKFFSLNENNFQVYEDVFSFYAACQKSGLIYSYVIDYHLKENLEIVNWDETEKTKVCFLSTLFSVYIMHSKKQGKDEFLSSILTFYTSISKAKFSFLHPILPEYTPCQKLEQIIDDRVQTNFNILSKNFSHLVTNTLLYIDILAYYNFLNLQSIDLKYFKEIEQKCLSVMLLSLNCKNNKSEYDNLLFKMFENSLRYTKYSDLEITTNLNTINFETSNLLERLYFLELAQMAIWSDGEKDENENHFIANLIKNLNLSRSTLNTDFELDIFILKYRKNIPYFNYKNPIQHFYTNTQETISKLIVRNKNRLLKELSESKELVKLLSKSTVKDLSKEEKKKVKKQLLDICKSVPSLTIFLLPGGGLLLPILIKFIPQLLPSAFNENNEE